MCTFYSFPEVFASWMMHCIDSYFVDWRLLYSITIFAGRLLAPMINELSKNHPQVTTYKIDIDQVGS